MIVSLGLALPACGPVVDPPVGDGGSQGTESQTSDPGSSGASPGDASSTSDGSSSGPSASTSGGPSGDSASGGEELLVPRESVITEVGCIEDGQTQLFFEANLMGGGYSNCLPPPEGIEGFLYLSYQGWDGQAGTVLVGPEEAASAAVGFVEVTGTLGIQVSEPYHPTFYTVDVTGSGGVALQGVIDTRLCVAVSPACEQ